MGMMKANRGRTIVVRPTAEVIERLEALAAKSGLSLKAQVEFLLERAVGVQPERLDRRGRQARRRQDAINAFNTRRLVADSLCVE